MLFKFEKLCSKKIYYTKKRLVEYIVLFLVRLNICNLLIFYFVFMYNYIIYYYKFVIYF